MAVADYRFRISAEGLKELASDLAKLGPTGDAAFAKLAASSGKISRDLERLSPGAANAARQLAEMNKAPSAALRGLSAAMDDVVGKVTGFSVSLGPLTSGLRAFGAEGAIVAGGIGLVAGAILKGASAANELQKAARGAAVSVTDIQAYRQVFNGMAGDVPLADAALKSLTKSIGDVALNIGGSKGAKQAFAALGVEVTATNGETRATQDILNDLADAFARIQSPVERNALAIKLFGDEAGPAMAAKLSLGSAALNKMKGDAEVVSASMVETAASIKTASDNFKEWLGLKFDSAMMLAAGSAQMTIEGFRDRKDQSDVRLKGDRAEIRKQLAEWTDPALDLEGIFGQSSAERKAALEAELKLIDDILLKREQEAAIQKKTSADADAAFRAKQTAEAREDELAKARHDLEMAQMKDRARFIQGEVDKAKEKLGSNADAKTLADIAALAGQAFDAREAQKATPKPSGGGRTATPAASSVERLMRELSDRSARVGLSPVETAALDAERQLRDAAASDRRAGLRPTDATPAEIANVRALASETARLTEAERQRAEQQAEAQRLARQQAEDFAQRKETLDQELSAQQRLGAAYAQGGQAVEDMTAQLEEERAVRAAVGDQRGEAARQLAEEARAIGRVKTANEQLADQMREVEEMTTRVGNGMASAFEQAILSGKSLGDVLRNLALDVSRIGFDTFVGGPLKDFLSPDGAGGNFLAGLLGGAGSGGSGTIAGDLAVLNGLKIDGARAYGGPVFPGSPYLVGERGPELFVPRQSGTVQPSPAAAPNITIVQHFAPGTDRRLVASAGQQARAAAEQVLAGRRWR